ncbi:unnamed protein product [Heligmosomoides polygyrus]|uniref:Peptidase S1 domain-containing protein n=1 Tax=Heligmosomoides polygyrus TaxID=6339 RepID=A0A183G1U5_HELPZ|nr:unnamed protein product [Heligmosomoides polygyrus]
MSSGQIGAGSSSFYGCARTLLTHCVFCASETRALASVISRFPNIPDGHAMICGGVVIAPNTVLTAAHCVYDGNTLWVSADVWPSLLRAAFFHAYEKLHFFLLNREMASEEGRGFRSEYLKDVSNSLHLQFHLLAYIQTRDSDYL